VLDRQRSTVDRRNWVIKLTEQGHQLADKAIEMVLLALSELGESLEPPAPMALHHLCMQLLGPRLVS
jgi:DNA-binding MarR family transcriptional regulator